MKIGIVNYRIIFRCTTCKYFNEAEKGQVYAKNRQTDFESLNDAMSHMQVWDGHTLEPEFVVEEEKPSDYNSHRD